MARATLTHRVEALEVVVGNLATRADVRELRADIRAEILDATDAFRTETRAANDALRAELLAAIRTGDEETQRFLRLMYEDLIDRIKTIGEGSGGR